jgi:hypothetical protein
MGEGHPSSAAGEGEERGNKVRRGFTTQGVHNQSKPRGPRTARPATDGSTRTDQRPGSRLRTKVQSPSKFSHCAPDKHDSQHGQPSPKGKRAEPRDRADTPTAYKATERLVSLPTPGRRITHRREEVHLDDRLIPLHERIEEDLPCEQGRTARYRQEPKAPLGSTQPPKMSCGGVKEHGIG